MNDFLLASDEINRLYLKRASIGHGLSNDVMIAKGSILHWLLEAIRKLELLREPGDSEPRVTDKVQRLSEELWASATEAGFDMANRPLNELPT